jgi:hypothetical protein
MYLVNSQLPIGWREAIGMPSVSQVLNSLIFEEARLWLAPVCTLYA